MTRNYKCPDCSGEFDMWDAGECPFCGLEKKSYNGSSLTPSFDRLERAAGAQITPEEESDNIIQQRRSAGEQSAPTFEDMKRLDRSGGL